MTIAFIVWPPDTDTYMWADKTPADPTDGLLCPTCGQPHDHSAINPEYKPPRTYYDVCRTYDGYYLISPRLRSFFERQRLSGLLFLPLRNSTRYSVLKCTNILEIIRPATSKMEEQCPRCGQCKSVWGNTPEKAHYKGVDAPLRHGLFFSDIRVGYYPQMGPMLIAGTETWRNMVAQGFKGLRNGEPIIN
jgi:hypothetical protein